MDLLTTYMIVDEVCTLIQSILASKCLVVQFSCIYAKKMILQTPEGEVEGGSAFSAIFDKQT
jgi:hypothetical protein